MFVFKKSSSYASHEIYGTNVANLLGLEDTKEYQALYLGKVKTLFGEPDMLTADMENLFSLYVNAEDTKGNLIPLEIYFGPSGPAISAPSGDLAEKAVRELAEKIMAAEPSDYEVECVYEDVGVTVKMGVKDGKPFCDSLFPNMPDDMM
ncbi:MAG: hypothetical protein ACI4M3_06195 [Acutalibacteraceae bacterium]